MRSRSQAYAGFMTSVIMAMAGTSGAAIAQSTDGAKSGDAPAPQAEHRGTLVDEIIVTGYHVNATTSATGIVTAIVDTPMSVSAISDKFLRDTASTQLMDAIGSLTGVTGQSNSGETGTNFSVRGFAVAPQVEGFDSLSVAAGLGSSVAVERIEVLKGPSAVFNGNVPPGGTINIIYKQPSYKAQTFGEITAGSWQNYSAQIFSTGSIIKDKLAYLIDGYYKNGDGWVRFTGHNERTIVAGLRYDPTDTIRINVGYRHAYHDMQMSTLPVSHEGYIGSGAPYGQPLDAWVQANYGPLEPPQKITVPEQMPYGRRDNVLGPQNYNKAKLDLYSGEIHWQPNAHIEIRDKFMYQKYNWRTLGIIQSGAKVIGADGRSSILSGLLASDITGSGWGNKLEAALHFDTGPIQHETLIGFQLMRSKTDDLNLWLGPPGTNASGQPWDYYTDGPRMLGNEFANLLAANPNPLVSMQDSGKLRTHAFYIAEQASMFDGRLRIVAGGRYTKTSADGLGVHDFTPQAAILVKPFSPDTWFGQTSFFFNYSESFTPSGLVEPTTGQVVPPQKGKGREAGVKTAWFGGRVASTISYFHDELNDIATPDYSQQGETGMPIYHLGGKGKSEGVEADISWTPSTALQLSANYTYLPTAKYTDYPNVPQQIGLRFPSTPKHAFNFTARYQVPDGKLAGAYVGGWLHTQSSTRGVMAVDWQYDVQIPSQTDLSAFIGYAAHPIDIRLNVQNVTNRGGYLPNNAFQPQPPRSFMVTIRYEP